MDGRFRDGHHYCHKATATTPTTTLATNTTYSYLVSTSTQTQNETYVWPAAYAAPADTTLPAPFLNGYTTQSSVVADTAPAFVVRVAPAHSFTSASATHIYLKSRKLFGAIHLPQRETIEAGENDSELKLSEACAKTCEAGTDMVLSHIRPSENEIKHELWEAGCDEQHANPDEQVIIPLFSKHLQTSLWFPRVAKSTVGKG